MPSLISKEHLTEMLEDHNQRLAKCAEYKNEYVNQIRNPNFPEHISETFCAYVLKHIDGMDDISRECEGDLTSSRSPVIEVKTFSSDGPSSFGPDKRWNLIVFLDARNPSNWKVWKSDRCNREQLDTVRVNRNATFGDQARQGRRPRMTFDDIKNQLPEGTFTEIFSGNPLDFLRSI